MSTEQAFPWRDASKARLERAFDELLHRLSGSENGVEPELIEAEPNALDQLLARFGLSPFERDLLLASAGHELDGRFPELLDGPPTFAGLSSRLADPHWSALAPDGPLRRGRLIALGGSEEHGLVRRPLKIEETVLHELLGLPQLDDALRPIVDPVPADAVERLLPNHAPAAERLTRLWSSPDRPLVWLVTSGAGDARAVACAAARAVGWSLFLLQADRLPDDPAMIEDLAERWRRDSVLQDFALIVDSGDDGPTARFRGIRQWLERTPGPTVWIGPEPPSGLERPTLRLDLPPVDAEQSADLWRRALGPIAASLNGAVDRLAAQFPLPARSVQEIADEVRAEAVHDLPDADRLDADRLEKELWQKARVRARGGLDRLAQRLDPVAGWPDLILPEPQMNVLRSVVGHVKHRHRVYDDWGFADKSRRGLGLSALFSGPSGTGKTLAAEVLARELELDLYRIDLSAVVSKYIGETERNLSQVFDAAERSGAVLLFDEADSLFGKRSEVRDSHDRYANLEISYLLQRVESYSGLAILTTNFEKSLDTAFARRLRFVVPFPMPSAADRRRIWRRTLPEALPTDNIDWDRLAQLNATGGKIRNISLTAAFHAADENRPMTMADLAVAARAEAAKSGRQVPAQELRGWEP